MTTIKRLSALKKNESGKIVSYTTNSLTDKLLEMGCLPGEIVKIAQVAPFNGPLMIEIAGSRLGLRKSEAHLIEVEIN